MNNKNINKLNAFLALFINKNQTNGQRPDIAEVDRWRLGKIKGQRSEEIKQFIASDPEVYKWWSQLRQEAKLIKQTDIKYNYIDVVKSWLAKLSQPKAYAPAVMTAVIAYFVVSILPIQSTSLVYLAQQDIEAWQQITKTDDYFKLGMTRQWQVDKKQREPTDDNIKNYQLGLNQFLKKPITVELSSMKLCEQADNGCLKEKQLFTVLGQWVSKANVICQQVNDASKNQIEDRLLSWQDDDLVKSQLAFKQLFKSWTNKQTNLDPCEKIQQMTTLGVHA